jgi:urea transport system ATP-binding protein
VSPVLLEIHDLHVAFDAFHAVDGLHLALLEHEVRFVIGPNGAGKTTLIDAITNLVRPTSGSILFAGEELVGRKEHAIVHAGIGRTFQTPSVFEQLSVLENVDIAATFRLPFRSLLRRRKGVSDEVAAALDSVGLAELRDVCAGSLSHGQKQWLEVAMVLVQQPRLLLLDEPVAGMTEKSGCAPATLSRRSPSRARRCSSSSTTWTSCAGSRTRSPSCTKARC